MMNNKTKIWKPADNLNDVFKNFSPEPLTGHEEFDAFYRGAVNDVRGEDKVKRISLGLNRAFQGSRFKCLVAGHPGVGKSTELTKLAFGIEEKYEVIRFSVTNELDPVSFRPFDVLLLIMIETAEQTEKILKENKSKEKLSDNLLTDVLNWFALEKVTLEKDTRIAGSIEAGAGAEGGSLWANVLGLFAVTKGEMKYSSDRKKEIVEYRLNRISEILNLANRLLDECNALLYKVIEKEWLIIGEDFDKSGIPIARVEDFFITYSNILKNLSIHIIATIPVTLAYSGQAESLLDKPFCIPDIPVFDKDHRVHDAGRKAIQSILEARMDAKLFDDGQIARLITASGGNLRDLFSMVMYATDNAIMRNVKTISEDDVTKSINNKRIEYRRSLGESSYDKVAISLKDKVDQLIKIYDGKPDTKITNQVMHSLLRARAVQEFNGEGWYGVHPLVVDLLADLEELDRADSGSVAGGTR